MANIPAIEGLADTSQARVMLFQSGKPVHAPVGAIGLQPLDATLSALAGLDATAGLIAQTGADAFARRTLTGTANQVAVTNGNGAAGNPTISLPSAITLTGKTVTGGAFDNAVIGGTTPAAGTFTTAAVGTFSAAGATRGISMSTSNMVQSSLEFAVSGNHLRFYNTNGQVGSITTSASATAFNTTSDYRRKPIREALNGFWGRLSLVVARRFRWDTGEWANGFIAHEFAAAYPSSVSGEKDAVDEDGSPVYQVMQASTSEVMADVIAALQDIKARLDAAGL